MAESGTISQTPHLLAWIPDPSPFTSARLVRGITACADEHRPLRVVLSRGGVEEVIRHLGQRRPLGVISYTITPRDMRRLLRTGLETVNLFGDLKESLVPSVRLDDVEVGRMGARHLLELGLEQFAFAGTHHLWSRHREQGFRAELEAHGHEATLLSSPGGDEKRFDYLEADCPELRKWIASLSSPCGLMACSDTVSSRVVQVAMELGIEVPHELAVLGVDNTELQCEHAAVPISSIDPGQQRMGYEALRLLLERLDDPDRADWTRVVAPRQVVVRQSTDILAIEDPDLHRAVAFIRDQACEGITVKDVMAEIPLSRRQLERRFSGRFGHSLGEEIRRVKLDRARKLLLETNLPLPDIAARCGFEYPTYLSRAVKKRFGLGPRELRRSAGDVPIR